MDNVTTTDVRIPSRTITRVYPQAIVLMCIIASMLNPLMAPLVIFYILRSRQSWSKCEYSRTYRHVNEAVGVALIGVVVTVTILVVGVGVLRVIRLNDEASANVTTTSETNVNVIMATTKHPNIILNDVEHMAIECNTSSIDSSAIVNMENSFKDVATNSDVLKQYLNSTHVLIIDRRTDKRWLLRYTGT